MRNRTNSSRPDRYRRAAKDQRCGDCERHPPSYQPRGHQGGGVRLHQKQGRATVERHYLRGPQKPNAGGGGRSERRLSAPQIGAGYTFTGADGWRRLIFRGLQDRTNRLAESFRRGRRSFGRCGAPRSRIGRTGARHSFGREDLCVGTVRPCKLCYCGWNRSSEGVG